MSSETSNDYISRVYSALKKLAFLITHPLTENETERQLQFLERFLDNTPHGFWLNNIPLVIPVFEVLSKKVDSRPEFHDFFEKLLLLSAITPIQMRASEKITYFHDLKQYFSMLGYLIACLNNEKFIALVLDTLLSLLTHKPPIYQCSVPIATMKSAASESKLPEIVGELVSLISDTFYQELLSIFYILLEELARNKKVVVNESTINSLFVRLDPTWRFRYSNNAIAIQLPAFQKNPHMEITCHILWILLDYVRRGEKSKIPSSPAMWSIEYALRWSTKGTARRKLRNQLMVIILRILQLFPQHKFFKTGLSEMILLLVLDKKKMLKGDDHIDVQFMRLTWMCLYFYQKKEELELIQSYRILEFFVQYITRRPLDAEHCYETEFIIMALDLLPRFANYAYSDFLWLNGPPLFCKKIRLFFVTQYDLNLLYAYIQCLSEILFFKNVKIENFIKGMGIADINIEIIDKLLDCPRLLQIHQNCITRGFCCLKELITVEKTVHDSSLNLIFKYFKRVLQPNQDDAAQDINTIICAVDFCWSVVTSKDNETFEEFHKRGGIYHLLDIICKSAFPVQVAILGLLADISQRPRCIPYLITWRKNGHTIMPFLLEMFRNGGQSMSCDAKQQNPFALQNPNLWINLCERNDTTLNINLSNLLYAGRIKMHLIVTSLTSKFIKFVIAANEQYKTYNNDLNFDNEITMVFAKNLESLILCEAWLNLAKELLNEGCDPTQEDKNLLCDNLLLIRNWQIYLQRLMQSIIKQELYQVMYDELHTYHLLKEARLADALDALKEIKYKSNCTERLFFLQKQMQLSLSINYLFEEGGRPRYHKANNVLAFLDICNQVTSLESDVIVKQGGGDAEDDYLDTVSPMTNVSLHSMDSPNDTLDDTWQVQC